MAKNFGKVLAGLLAASAMTASASAIDFLHANTERQVNWGNVYALQNLDAFWLGGNLRAASVALGNNMSITTEGSSWIMLTQVQLGDVGAELKAKVKNVAGDVDLSSTAICNNISTSTTNSAETHVGSDQRCETEDPYAITNVSAVGIGGNLDISAAAVANNASFSAESARFSVSSTQINPGLVVATVNARIADVGGDVAVNATAIGNNLTINHSFGGTP